MADRSGISGGGAAVVHFTPSGSGLSSLFFGASVATFIPAFGYRGLFRPTSPAAAVVGFVAQNATVLSRLAYKSTNHSIKYTGFHAKRANGLLNFYGVAKCHFIDLGIERVSTRLVYTL